jgi:hypothetical protein
MMYTFKFAIYGAEGRTRTDTEVAPQQFLRLPRLPFRHFGALKLENLILIYSSSHCREAVCYKSVHSPKLDSWCRGAESNR